MSSEALGIVLGTSKPSVSVSFYYFAAFPRGTVRIGYHLVTLPP